MAPQTCVRCAGAKCSSCHRKGTVAEPTPAAIALAEAMAMECGDRYARALLALFDNRPHLLLDYLAERRTLRPSGWVELEGTAARRDKVGYEVERAIQPRVIPAADVDDRLAHHLLFRVAGR